MEASYSRTLSCRVVALLCLVASIFDLSSANQSPVAHGGGAGAMPYFQIRSRDFRNTQMERICLLARMNVSVEITYSSGGNTHSESIELPASASTHGSYCDHEYVSSLAMTFDHMSVTLGFRRAAVPNVDTETQNQYCLRCDVSNWNLDNITVHISNVTSSYGGALPPTTVQGHASKMPASSGPLYYGSVDVQRSYKCKSEILVPLAITEATDLASGVDTSGQWSLNLLFYHVEFEPFLVTNSIHDGQPFFKDPLLCSEVQVFHVLVILLPVVYFIIFVATCRLREKYGCPPKRNRSAPMKVLRNEPDDSTKRPLSSRDPTTSHSEKKDVTITFTPPDSTQATAI